MSRSRMGAINKRKGSDAERHYARIFRELGYIHCETARYASKHHDNAKIDLIFIPFNIQIKAGKQKNMNVGKELFAMVSMIKVMFPEGEDVHNKPNLLFHYEEVGRGKKRLPQHEKVYMSLQQFKFFKEKVPSFRYDELKEFKHSMDSEFKVVVNMTFEYFKNEIILNLYSNGNKSNTTD